MREDAGSFVDDHWDTREREVGLGALVDRSPLGACIVDEAGRIVSKNRSWDELWGTAGEEHEGGTSDENVLESGHPCVDGLAAYVQTAIDGEFVSTPPLLCKPAGREDRPLWIQGRAYPIGGGYGSATEVAVLLEDVTDRKLAEDGLRESERRHRELLERVPAVVYVDGVDGSHPDLYRSPFVEDLLGYSSEELRAGSPGWVDLIHDGDRDRVLSEYRRARETGVSFKSNYRLVARDGRTVWVRDEGTLARDGEGNPAYWQGVVVDLTERKLYEETLKENEERFRSVVQGLGEGLMITDLEDVVLFANSRMAELSGYPLEEMVGRPAYELLLTSEAWDGARHRNKTRSSGDSERYELELTRKDGTSFWTEITATPYRGPGGEVIGTLGAVADISERKRSEEALRQSEERFRGAFESAPVGVALVGIDRRYLRVNEALCGMLGYTEEELLARTSVEITHPEDLERSRARTERLLAGRPDADVLEKRYLRADGSVVWVLSSVSLVRDSAGDPSHFVSLFQDVTRRKETEEALKESEQSHRRQARELSLLHQVRTALAREIGLGGVFRTVVEAVAETYGYTLVSAYLLDGEELVLQHQVGYAQVIDRVRVPKGVMGRVARSGRAELLEDVREDPAFLGAIEGIVSEVCVPLLDEGKVVGTLNVESTHGMGLTQDDLRLMEALGDHVGLAVGRARLHARARESEARFRSLIQNASDVVMVVDGEGAVRYISPAVERVLGYRPEEVIGRDAFEVVHPEDEARIRRSVAEAAERPGAISSMGLRLQHANGTWRHVDSVLTNLLDDPAVRGLVINTRDITERKLLEKRLERLAFHDPLTGLANRSLLIDRLSQALARLDRRGGPVAVGFLDLDNFKVINDSMGHDAGDRLLTTVASRLKECVRPEDTVARLGGDEFVLLLEGAGNPSDAHRVAKRLNERLSEPFYLDGRELFVNGSVGLALTSRPSEDPEELLRRADLALYAAKQNGKARYEVFDPGMSTDALRRLETEQGLRRALERGEFRLYYQPKVIAGSGEVATMEALLRWEHPERGLLSPEDFLSVAEETGLIGSIDDWVLGEACRQGVAWQGTRAGRRDVPVSVNVSAKQFARDDLADKVAGTLAGSGLRAENLCLEVREGVLMADSEASIGRLAALRDLGVRVALDGFGTAYSSLAQLRRFPLDLLQLDRSLVARICNEPGNEAVVAAVIDLSHALGWGVVGQGVEEPDQHARLAELGCDLLQGRRLFSPVAAETASGIVSAEPGP